MKKVFNKLYLCKSKLLIMEKSIQHTIPLEIQTRTLEHLEKDDDEIAFYE